MERLSLSQLSVLKEMLTYLSLNSKEKGDYIILPKYVMFSSDYISIKEMAKIINDYYWDKVIENEKK